MIKVIGTGSYILYRHEERLFMSVLCGTVGLYEIELELTQKEKKEYGERGNLFLIEFARKVSKSPKSFSDRHSPISHVTGTQPPSKNSDSPPQLPEQEP